MHRIPLDPNEPLNPGDRVELHFKSVGMTYIKAAQIALIERRLSGRDDFEIDSVATPTDRPTTIIVEVRIKGAKQPGMAAGFAGVVITCASIGGLIIATGIVYKLTLEKTFLVIGQAVSSPAGQIAIGGMGVGLAAAAVIALLALLPKK